MSAVHPHLTVASAYSFEALAELYNQTRIDYIVPMPMNAKRMMDYVHDYNVDLDASTVALNDEGLPCGVIMAGFRDRRCWITRLGVIPERRGHRVGQSLMDATIEQARQRRVQRIQLEVIKGNKPAQCLFEKLGFVETRELMVVRRPPTPIRENSILDGPVMIPIAPQDIPQFLDHRDSEAAWTEETPSLLQSGQLQGYTAQCCAGETGWIIYRLGAFQLSHIVVCPTAANRTTVSLLHHLHKQHPVHDTQIENIPRSHPSWSIFQALGYFEVFGRIEMRLDLGN